jgi:hypothetical protein
MTRRRLPVLAILGITLICHVCAAQEITVAAAADLQAAMHHPVRDRIYLVDVRPVLLVRIAGELLQADIKHGFQLCYEIQMQAGAAADRASQFRRVLWNSLDYRNQVTVKINAELVNRCGSRSPLAS